MHISSRTFLIALAKGVTIFFTIATLILVIISLVHPEWIKSIILWTGKLIETLGAWNYGIAFLSAFAESLPIIGTAVPGMNIMILVGGFWGKEHLVFTIVCASFGAILGNYVGYWIGKCYGTEIIKKYGYYIGLGKTEQKILEKQIKKNGFWYILLGKFHNFLRAFVPFIAGMSNMQRRNFWIYNTISSLLWAISMNLLGLFFIDKYELILDNIGKIFTLFIVGIGLYIYLFQKEAFKKYLADKEREIEEQFGSPK